uniref:Reverse transcriptase domain-containing protein n=1 Tax=Tanacetum cinerariifolium TaxID=118510 RepID=A0A6L2JF21_TANCI|nr:hypothetical protein [Tanacetum cinerariifolium]
MPEDSKVPIILGRPFLATARAIIDVFNKKITLRVRDDEVILNIDQSIKRPTTKDDECYEIDDLDDTIIVETQKLLANEEHESFLSRGLGKSIDQSYLESYESTDSNDDNGSESENLIRRINSVNTPYPVAQETTKHDNVKSEHLYSTSANEIDEKNPELQNLPQHLEYGYLHGDKSFPIIISSELSEKEKMSLLQVLEKRKGALAWKMSDIKGINSSWVSPIHIVPKKGGMTVVLNDNNELIPSRTVTRWRDSSKFLSLRRIKKRQPSPVLVGLSLTNECCLDYAMLLLPFKDAGQQSSMTWWKTLWKYSWMTSQYLVTLLIVV